MSTGLETTHPFLRTYLRYIENTETPRLHHIWAAISGLSACMGRRCYLTQSIGNLYPNLFIVLVGPPAVRKSTALKMMKKLLGQETNVRFAPNDTGGQRQGIIASMNDYNPDGQDLDGLEAALTSEGIGELASIGNIGDAALEKLASIQVDLRDPRTLYICESELKAFLGENNTQMTTFMCKMYDGDPYEYRLKSSTHRLSDALLGMLGCTTPSEIALALPHEAIGGGFTSRIIFVHADRVHKKIPRPTIDEKAGQEIAQIYSYVFHAMDGALTESADAARAFDEIYMRGIVIQDPRFVNYVDRRNSTHLPKVAMALAASRKSKTIEKIDVEAADQLLMLTEENMPDALGEYGMSPLSAAKQKLLEFINSSTGPVPEDLLYNLMARDMKQIDFKNCLSELVNTGKIKSKTIMEMGNCIVAVSDSAAKKARKSGLDAVATLLQL